MENFDYSNKSFPPLQNDLILRAARREHVSRAPVWIMRQAGRYLPEFRATRAEKDFFQVCRTPTICCDLTLQPIRRYKELDAAIIFSDILVVPQAMGLPVEMKPGKGPVFPSPLLKPEEIETRLSEPDVNKELKYVFDAITLTRHKLEGKVPLIGFSGAPWTLIAYMIEGEGSKTFSKAKRWLYQYPEQSHNLFKKVTKVVIEYLIGQAEAGAQLLQVFDSWASELSPDMYSEFGVPYLKEIAEKVKSKFPDIPLIVFPKGANSSLEDISHSKYDVIGIDWSMDPSEARKAVGGRVALQGNLDPCVLYADETTIRKYTQQMLNKFQTADGLIANLGHGVNPDHSPENVGFYLKAIHELSSNIASK